MSANGLQIVFGAAGFISSHIDHVKQWLQVVEQHGIKTIDTAHGYGASEELLGQAGAASKFTIDSKHPGGFGAHPSTRESILQLGKQSLERLQTDAVSNGSPTWYHVD
jgi:aflatoxin B1 aldehyde reductase